MLFGKKNKRNAELGKIIVGENVSRQTIEGYNRLKDNILYMNADGVKKVIQIESAVKGEAKTTVTCNLAVSLGLTDKKVIVLDLDFYRPRTHRMFGLSKDDGIAEYILGNRKLDEIIKHTSYKNVDLITRGAEIYNSSLVFVSDKFKSMIEELRGKYDYIFLDCPPVLQVSDYIHIAHISDGVLFMVCYASTTKTQVAEAVKELKKNGADILGTVFTMYDRKKDKNYYSGKYYDYTYGESSENNKENVEE